MPIKLNQLPINFDMQEIKELGAEYQGIYFYAKIMAIILMVVLFDSGIPQFHDVFGAFS